MAAWQKFKCPCCGGVVVYDLASQKTTCAYCETEFEVPSIQSYLEDVMVPEQDDMAWDNSEAGNRHPDLMIPFKLDKKAAQKTLKKQLTRKKLLPKIFTDEKHLAELKGIYVPVWMFQADAQGKMVFKATRVREESTAGRDETVTMHYHVARAGTMTFPSMTVAGSSEIDDDLIKTLEPFHIREATDFSIPDLSDHFVYQCDVSPGKWVDRINERMKADMEISLRNTVGDYADVTEQSSVLRLQNSSIKSVLCPVWVLTTTWKRKQYTLALNGQTGRLAGDLPMDGKAFWRWYSCLFAITAAVCLLAGWLLWLL